MGRTVGLGFSLREFVVQALLFVRDRVMPKARKRKLPVTATVSADKSSSKPESSRSVIRRFHVLLKERAKLQANGEVQTADACTALAEIESEIQALGGLESYQRMSAIGQGNDRGGGSEKVLISWLKDMGLAKTSSNGVKLQ